MLILDSDEDDLPPMLPLEDNAAEKLEPEESIDEIVRLILRKRKTTGTGLENLTPNKLLIRFPILLAEVEAGKNSSKLKNEIS